MATTFKTFLNNDIASTRTMLHEAIPITGSLVSGTYGGVTVTTGSEPHVKNYSHGMFQSVYDYPYLSSSANHIFDIAVGVSSKGTLYSATTSQQSKKTNIYNQMAQVLMGHDVTGSIQEFDADGNILAGGTKLQEVFFLNFARLLAKDEIKKGSFQLELGTTPAHSQATNGEFTERIKLTDASGSDGYFVNSPAGEYGILYAQTTADGDGTLSTAVLANETVGTSTTHPACGLIFYQAGIAVVSGSVFNSSAIDGLLTRPASARIVGTAALNGADGTNFILRNADESTVTFHTDPTKAFGDTSSDGGDHTWEVNTLNISGGSEVRKATQALYIACKAAIDAGELDMTIDPTTVDPIASGQEYFILTQTTSGVTGNTAITLVTGVTAFDGVDATVAATTFTHGADSVALHTGGQPVGLTGFQSVTGSTIEATCNAIRNRIYNLSFNNSTELNSSIYFCRINHNDFNYSSNPTYLSGSKLRVKNSTVDNPVTYLTTIGLYSADNELLAVAKLSEPIKKDPSTEMTLRVRLDY